MRRAFTLFFVRLVASALALAHHVLAAFDQSTTVMVEGTVTEFHFVNPHRVVEFEVKGREGSGPKMAGRDDQHNALERMDCHNARTRECGDGFWLQSQERYALPVGY